MATFEQFRDTFPKDSNEKGQAFEKVLCEWFLNNHPLYKDHFTKVMHFKDWPKKWFGKDIGTDLIAEDIHGKICAIQAKFYHPSLPIPTEEINSFLTDSARKVVDYRLLIATTDKYSAIAANKIDGAEKPVQTFLLENFLAWETDWPDSLDSLNHYSPPEKHTPFPYQRTAINDVVNNIKIRGQLIMACGTGKTKTALWISEELESNVTLVLLPSLLLLSKTLLEWKTHSKNAFNCLPVCSDESATKDDDSINLASSDLCLRPTTDVAEISQFLNSSGRRVIFSTYQSSKKIAKAFERENIKPLDLIIADEAHRCTGMCDSSFSVALDDNQIPAAKRLFMTATPNIASSQIKRRAVNSGIEIFSMDDEQIYGPVLHKLSFGHAIQPPDGSEPLLTDYQVVIVGVDNPRYSSMIDERTLVQTETKIKSDAQSFASHIALAKAIKDYDLRKIISFHSRVKTAENFARTMPEVVNWMPEDSRPEGELLTNSVKGEMSTYDRNKRLKELGKIKADQRYLLSNARCLAEGIDVPTLDGVAFMDPKYSEIDIIQAVGRAIRLADGKDFGYIIIPVFVDDHVDPNEVLSSSPFKVIWSIVNALRSHDEELGGELDQLRQSLGRRGTVGRSSKIILDFPTTITHDFEKALETKLIESTSASWEFFYGLLEQFVEETESILMPDKHIFKGVKLGVWVGNQRQRKHLLQKEKVQRLDSLGFIWDVLEYTWELRFSEYVKFLKANPNTEITEKNSSKKLKNWVSVTRKNKDQINIDKKKRLDAIGFVWDPLKHKWNQNYLQLQLLVDISEGKFHEIDLSGNVELQSWVRTQRRQREKGEMEPWKIVKLDAIGFDWRKDNDRKWDEFFELLVAFKRENKHLNVPDKKMYKGKNLGTWVSRLRRFKNRLSKDQIVKLESIGFEFSKEDSWGKMYQILVEYHNEFKNCLVKQNAIYKGERLGNWVSSQRIKRKQLTKNQINLLNKLDFSWDYLETIWMTNYELLKQFKAEFGHTNIKQSEKYKGENLGVWLTKQRTYYRGKGGRNKNLKLKPKHQKLLNELGVDWSPPAYKVSKK